MSFDIVIPVGPTEISFIQLMVERTKLNVIGFRNVYLVSYDDTLVVDGCITISESLFPFSITDICSVIGDSWRKNWYLQQLLKFYALFIIPDILNNILIIDSDTFFINPTLFFNENNAAMFYYLDENCEDYFIHMKLLHPSLYRVEKDKSGVIHHVMFQKKYLTELFELVEKYHNTLFWKAFINCINPDAFSGASEYEIYFNFMLQYHRDQIVLRKPKYKWIKTLDDIYDQNYDFVSYHHWYR